MIPHLPVHKNYCRKWISCRFLKRSNRSSNLILALPGGPAISSQYLDKSMAKLGKSLKTNSAVMDLPNNGNTNSYILPNSLTYQDYVDIICNALIRIKQRCNKLILVGHSLGARLSLDLLSIAPELIHSIIAISFSIEFNPSDKFINKYDSLRIDPELLNLDSERKYEKFWQKILPLYIHNKISKKDFSLLTSEIRWQGNERVIATAIPFNEAYEKIQKLPDIHPITFLEGRFDIILPDKNKECLEKVFPKSKIYIIPKSGHFPMLENPKRTLEILTKALGPLVKKERLGQ